MTLDADAKFERVLLESARGDARPRDVSDAWARFAASAASVGSGADAGRSAAADPIPRAAARAGGVRAGVGRWLLLGALGGAAPMVALTLARRPAAVVVHAADVDATRPFLGARASAPLTPPPTVPSAAAPAPGPRATTPPGQRAATRGAPVRACRSDDGRAPSSDVPRSTLSAEVSRIDTARTASALGDYDEAMRLVDHYHRDFPGGALAADADVVALEAAAAKHDQPEVTRRAALFLARYPNDPHAARVRALVAHAGGDVHQ